MSNSEEFARPPKVDTAVKLLYLALGMSAIRLIFGTLRIIIDSSRPGDAQSIAFVLFLMLCVIGLHGILINLISIGRNWARITVLVFFIFGVPSILRMIQSLTHDPISNVLGLVLNILQAIALVFLFQGDSAAWFNAMKNLKDENAQPVIQPDRE